MELENAIKHVIDGEGIAFLGAGFSVDATNIIGKKLKDASELSKELCSELDIKANRNLSDVSDFYMEMVTDGPRKMVEKLVDYYRCNTVEDEHKIIASLPWKRVYTTNYDNVFELASNKNSIRRTGYIISDDMKKVEKKIVYYI